MTLATNFKYTFGISKAFSLDDGRTFITGEASGPEIDATVERMDGTAITRFATQIAEMAAAGDPLVYRDAHAPDGVLRDLGWITRGWIDDRLHLGVEVELDWNAKTEKGNPASGHLFGQLEKGKQYGMSVAGVVNDYEDIYDATVGKAVRTYKDVTLTEISNTTRPAWTPSLGTVLSKAIDDAQAESIAKQGENVTPEEIALAAEAALAAAAEAAATAEKSDDVQADGEAEVEKTDAETDDTAVVEDVEETQKSEDEVVEQITETDATEKAVEGSEDVEKAGRSVSAATAARLLASYNDMTSTLTDLGVLTAPEVAETDAAKSISEGSDEALLLTKALEVEKTELVAKVADLTKSLDEANARIVELENTPASPTPPVIKTSGPTEAEALEAFKALAPSERLRMGFALAHSA